MLRAGTNGNSSKLTTTLSVSGTLLFSGRLWKPLNLETEPSSRAELPLSAAPVFDLDTNWTVRQLEKNYRETVPSQSPVS